LTVQGTTTATAYLPTYQYLPSPIPPPLSPAGSRAPKQNQTQSSTCCSCRFPPRTGSQLASYPGDADVLLGVEGQPAARETTVEMAVTAASYVSPSLSAHARCRRPAGWSCGRRFIRWSVSSSCPFPKFVLRCGALRCRCLVLSCLALPCLALRQTQPSPAQAKAPPHHLDECRPNADRHGNYSALCSTASSP
jgi:hypothetical protein